jgi:hypothetical protein
LKWSAHMLKNLKFLFLQGCREPSWIEEREWSEKTPGVSKWTWACCCKVDQWVLTITLSIFLQTCPFDQVNRQPVEFKSARPRSDQQSLKSITSQLETWALLYLSSN